jgi:hypothetical protein
MNWFFPLADTMNWPDSASPGHRFSDVDQLMLNARLRDDLEPFWDEAIHLVDRHRMSTGQENQYLASMLAWERAPVLPISHWFEPELLLPHPDLIQAEELGRRLAETLERLFQQHVTLEMTDHLSDRELCCVLLRDILPAEEKKLPTAAHPLTWHCLDMEEDPETWLRYYASHDERASWHQETGQSLPPMEPPPHPRTLPQHRSKS